MDHTIAREDAVFIGIGWRHGRSESESRFPVDGAIDEKSLCFGLSDKPALLGENWRPATLAIEQAGRKIRSACPLKAFALVSVDAVFGWC